MDEETEIQEKGENSKEDNTSYMYLNTIQFFNMIDSYYIMFIVVVGLLCNTLAFIFFVSKKKRQV